MTEYRPATRYGRDDFMPRPKSRTRYYAGIVIEAALILFAVWTLLVVSSGVPQ